MEELPLTCVVGVMHHLDALTLLRLEMTCKRFWTILRESAEGVEVWKRRYALHNVHAALRHEQGWRSIVVATELLQGAGRQPLVIVVTGDVQVGKTSLLYRWLCREHAEEYVEELELRESRTIVLPSEGAMELGRAMLKHGVGHSSGRRVDCSDAAKRARRCIGSGVLVELREPRNSERLRPLSYEPGGVVLVLCARRYPRSMESAAGMWVNEALHYVGQHEDSLICTALTQVDVVWDEERAKRLGYGECSADVQAVARSGVAAELRSVMDSRSAQCFAAPVSVSAATGENTMQLLEVIVAAAILKREYNLQEKRSKRCATQ